jgi:hypothetical protein
MAGGPHRDAQRLPGAHPADNHSHCHASTGPASSAERLGEMITYVMCLHWKTWNRRAKRGVSARAEVIYHRQISPTRSVGERETVEHQPLAVFALHGDDEIRLSHARSSSAPREDKSTRQ